MDLMLHLLEDGRHTTQIMQRIHRIFAAGLDIDDTGCDSVEPFKIIQGQFDTQLVGKGDQMHGSVGASADGQIHADCIFQCLFGDDIGGLQILKYHLYDSASHSTTAQDLIGVNSRDRRCAGEGHAQCLCQDLHGVGRSHIRAGTHGGTCACLCCQHLFRCCLSLGSLAVAELGHITEHELLRIQASCQHGAAGTADGGNVQSGSCQQSSRNDVITAGQQNQAVKMLNAADHLDAACHQISHGKVHTHGLAADGNLRARRGNTELKGNTACLPDALLDGIGQLTQVCVSRGILTECIGNADVRTPVQLCGIIAAALVYRSCVGCAVTLEIFLCKLHPKLPPVIL